MNRAVANLRDPDGAASRLSERTAKTLGLLPVLVLVALAGILLGSRWWWVCDLLIAGFWWVWTPLACTFLVRLVRRRTLFSAVLMAAMVMVSWPFWSGREVFLPRNASTRTPEDVSILIFNADMGNLFHDAVTPFVSKQGADIAVILEPVWEFYIGVIKDGIFKDEYPFTMVRESDGDLTPRILVISRWKLSGLTESGLRNADGMACLVDRPEELGGRFTLLVAHPPSPRSPARWRDGNRSVRHLAAFARSLIEAGDQVLLAADLNAAPGSVRDRTLRSESTLTRAKPVVGRWGSFPASWPIARIAIDDVWCPSTASVRSWKTVRSVGSDHRAVRAVLWIPRLENAP